MCWQANRAYDKLVWWQFGWRWKNQGHKPDGKKLGEWPIQNPIPSADGAPNLFKFHDGWSTVVAWTWNTSGTYNRLFDDNGVEYSHIINQALAKPLLRSLCQRLCFGHRPRIHDAWAQPCCALEAVKGEKIA